MTRNHLYKKLRSNADGSVDVIGYYEEGNPSSVLYGQTIRQYLATYRDEAEARREHPEAESWYHPMLEPQVDLSHLPGEDDPVPGGMYPDDY